MKLEDLDGFMQLLNQAAKVSTRFVTVDYLSMGNYRFMLVLEFEGRKAYALIQPELIITEIEIRGALLPAKAHLYGPYSCVMQIQVSLAWSPADQVVDVGIIDAETGTGSYKRLTGGSGSYSSPALDETKSYYVAVASPFPLNTKIITYDGAIYLYSW
jgi:hypothetical protein